MSPLRLHVVTAEREVFTDDVDMVIAPGCEGQLGILPKHAPLMTTLQVGELRAKKGSEEISMVITGGFLEVFENTVTVLANAAERADEVDIARAEEARRRAQERLRLRAATVDLARAEASLRRSLMRLKVVERRRRSTSR
jgi:F-type H+-transporting ATPase subunit epsilon